MFGFIVRLREFFAGPQPEAPRALRNKPGGMAWIVKAPYCERGHVDVGQHVMVGLPVRIVAKNPSTWWPNCWIIDPPPRWVATCDFDIIDPESGNAHIPCGAVVSQLSLRDDLLLPWQEGDVTEEEVAALYRGGQRSYTITVVLADGTEVRPGTYREPA